MQDLIEEVLVPTEEVVEIRRGAKIQSEKKFFPGYILVKMEMTDQSWHLIKSQSKVTGFLGGKGKPIAISEAEAKRLRAVLPELLISWPALSKALESARSMGVMRWGAAQPLNHPVPSHLQWCHHSAVGFCGDWIEGPHFGTGEGAIRSGVALAERLTADS